MNPLWREYRILWLKIRLRWWQWALENIDPCHDDVPLVIHTIWKLHDRIRALEGWEVKCEHCGHEFQIEHVEY